MHVYVVTMKANVLDPYLTNKIFFHLMAVRTRPFYVYITNHSNSIQQYVYPLVDTCCILVCGMIYNNVRREVLRRQIPRFTCMLVMDIRVLNKLIKINSCTDPIITIQLQIIKQYRSMIYSTTPFIYTRMNA